MPFALGAGRRRLVRWLVVPLAAAAAVTTVQVVDDGPGPLTASSADAAPTFRYGEEHGGRTYTVTALDGAPGRPVGGLADVCGGDVSAGDTCLTVRFWVGNDTGRLVLRPTESATIGGNRIEADTLIAFQTPQRRVSLPNGVGEKVLETVSISELNVGFQRVSQTLYGKTTVFYRLWMPGDANEPARNTIIKTVRPADPQWAGTLRIVADLREAHRQERAMSRNSLFTGTTIALGGLAALAVGAASGLLPAVAAFLGSAVTSSFFLNNSFDAKIAYHNALSHAADELETTFGVDLVVELT